MGSLETRVAKLERRGSDVGPQYGRVFLVTDRMGHEDEDRARQVADIGVTEREDDLVIQLIGFRPRSEKQS